MTKIRYLTKEDLNRGAGRGGNPGEVVLHHLDGPSLDYTLARWHKNIGDQVRVGDIIATVESERLALDIEVFEEGTVAELLFDVGSQVSCGAILARITRTRKEPTYPHAPKKSEGSRGSS